MLTEVAQEIRIVNECELNLWASHSEVQKMDGLTVIFKMDTPDNFFLNCAFSDSPDQPWESMKIPELIDFFERKGCTPGVRDYINQFHPQKERSFKWLFREAGNVVNSEEKPLKLEKLSESQIPEFAEAVKHSFGYSPAFVTPFIRRMKAVSLKRESLFLRFSFQNETVGYASLFHASQDTLALMNLCVLPQMRNKGFGHAILNSISKHEPRSIYFVTENKHLIEHVCPKTAFRKSGDLNFIRLEP